MERSLTRSLPAEPAAALSTLLVLADAREADGHTLLRLGHQQNALLLARPAELDEWLCSHGKSVLLLAAGELCLPALTVLAHHPQRALGALLLSPGGDLAAAAPLPFPSLTVCHPPQAHWPRLTSTVAFASRWGSRLHTLRGEDDAALGELRLLLQQLRHQVEGWPQGNL